MDEATTAAPGEASAPQSRGWLAVLALLVVVAVLVGMNVVLFIRVNEAQNRADEAVTLAGGSQDQIQAQIDAINTTLGTLTKDNQNLDAQVATLTTQVNALRKCVNNALDGFSQANQTGKPVSVTKC